MKKVLLIFLFVFFSLFVSCSSQREFPPDDYLIEYGVTNIITSASICVDQAKDMLDDYSIANNYPTVEKDAIGIYLGTNETSGKYFEIYVPVQKKYDILVREIVFPDFSVVENHILDYNNADNEYYIALCDNYCNIFFPEYYMREMEENNTFLNALDSIFLLKIGKVNSLEEESPSIMLGRQSDNDFVVFYFDFQSKLIVDLFEIII